ncbi:PAS domain-containing protein [Alsobacter soli]|uniref:PAS domain-containing protein n=1 Tax=Alsobacter soli TaxID=2109933 RepID=UPI0013048FE3|nr:PAS domain-containing protein [Alsobacter soli]
MKDRQGTAEVDGRLGRTWVGFAIAVVGAALAAGLRVALADVFHGFPFSTFMPVVVLATIVGGPWPGALACLLGGLSAWYIGMPPAWAWTGKSPGSAIGIVIFGLTSAGIIAAVRWMQSLLARSREERATIAALLDKQQRISQDLQAALARLEVAVTAGALGVWEWDLATDAMMYSPKAKEIYGFGPDDRVTLKAVSHATHPEDLGRTTELARRALDPGIRAKEPYEFRIRRLNDGEERWLQAHGEAIFDHVGRPQRYIGTIQDITASKAAALAVLESELRLRLAIDAGRMAVWSYDVQRQEIIGSPELYRLLGFDPARRPSFEQMRAGYPPGEEERVQAAGREALERGERFFEVEYRYGRADGAERWLMMRAEIVLDDAGQPRRVVGVVIDVTERRQAEERQQILTAELTHRVKNILAVVQSIADITLRRSADLPTARQALAGRLSALAKAHDLLFAGGAERSPLRRIVDEATLSFGPDIQARVQRSGPDVFTPGRLTTPLSMVLHELIVNAIKYGALSNEEGRVDIGWSVEGGLLTLTWTEQGGPPVTPPTRQGFGSVLLQRSLARDLGGRVEIAYPETGVRCEITVGLGES